MLSTEQVKHYQDQGYLLYHEQLLPRTDFQNLKALFQEHLSNKGDKQSDELDTPHFHDSRLLQYLLADSVLDKVQQLIGPNIGLWSSHFISKPPKTGRRTPWHEDSAYWKGKFDRFDGIVTVWLSVDGASRENGCMGFIPGTHSNGFSQYEAVDNKAASTFETEIAGVDEDQAVWVELAPGECSFHDSRLVHGAGPNTSTQPRTGYTMRYFDLAMKFDPSAAPEHKIWHCRGQNLGNNPLEYA